MAMTSASEARRFSCFRSKATGDTSSIGRPRVAAGPHRAVAAHEQQASAEVARVRGHRVDLRRARDRSARTSLSTTRSYGAKPTDVGGHTRRAALHGAETARLERLAQRRAVARRRPRGPAPATLAAHAHERAAHVVVRRRIGARVERRDGDVVAVQPRIAAPSRAAGARPRPSRCACARTRTSPSSRRTRSSTSVGDRARRDDAQLERLALVRARRRAHADDAHVGDQLLVEDDDVDLHVRSDRRPPPPRAHRPASAHRRSRARRGPRRRRAARRGRGGWRPPMSVASRPTSTRCGGAASLLGRGGSSTAASAPKTTVPMRSSSCIDFSATCSSDAHARLGAGHQVDRARPIERHDDGEPVERLAELRLGDDERRRQGRERPRGTTSAAPPAASHPRRQPREPERRRRARRPRRRARACGWWKRR